MEKPYQEGLECQANEYGFYSECNEAPLNVFKQESDIILPFRPVLRGTRLKFGRSCLGGIFKNSGGK